MARTARRIRGNQPAVSMGQGSFFQEAHHFRAGDIGNRLAILKDQGIEVNQVGSLAQVVPQLVQQKSPDGLVPGGVGTVILHRDKGSQVEGQTLDDLLLAVHD